MTGKQRISYVAPGHHQVLAGDSGSVAPGLEIAAALAASTARDDNWAKR